MTKKNIENTELNFAVVELQGTQLLVEVGKKYTVGKMQLEKGKKFTCDKVLMSVVGDKVKVGKPYLEGASVEFEVASQFKGEKVDSFKYTAKSRVRRRFGHRPQLTKLLVKKIDAK